MLLLRILLSAAVQLNIDLTSISRWSKLWLVDFNPNKTESLNISRKRNKPNHPLLMMGNTMVKESDNHKHLGLIFSNDGSWNQHIGMICVKALKRLGALRKHKFSLDRRSLNKLYITYIRSLLEYGNIIWDNTSTENKKPSRKRSNRSRSNRYWWHKTLQHT